MDTSEKPKSILEREGLELIVKGTCPIHGIEMLGFNHSVLAVERVNNDPTGEIIGYHQFDGSTCEMCWQENHDRNGLPIKFSEKSQDPFKHVRQFNNSKHVDIRKDMIVTFSYEDEISVSNFENMKNWIYDNIRSELRVKFLDVSKYIELTKNRYMNNATKEAYLEVKADIEQSDLLIVNSIADYKDIDADSIYNAMLLTKEECALMVITIPDSEERLKQLPVKLRHRLENAQRMSLMLPKGKK